MTPLYILLVSTTLTHLTCFPSLSLPHSIPFRSPTCSLLSPTSLSPLSFTPSFPQLPPLFITQLILLHLHLSFPLLPFLIHPIRPSHSFAPITHRILSPISLTISFVILNLSFILPTLSPLVSDTFSLPLTYVTLSPPSIN